MGLARSARAIGVDGGAVITAAVVEAAVAGVRDITLSLPRVIGARGMVETFRSTPDPTSTARWPAAPPCSRRRPTRCWAAAGAAPAEPPSPEAGRGVSPHGAPC